MTIKAIKEYNDSTLENKFIDVDDEYEVDDTRGQKLIEFGYAIEVKTSKIKGAGSSWQANKNEEI